jgi:hypothetical protein
MSGRIRQPQTLLDEADVPHKKKGGRGEPLTVKHQLDHALAAICSLGQSLARLVRIVRTGDYLGLGMGTWMNKWSLDAADRLVSDIDRLLEEEHGKYSWKKLKEQDVTDSFCKELMYKVASGSIDIKIDEESKGIVYREIPKRRITS